VTLVARSAANHPLALRAVDVEADDRWTPDDFFAAQHAEHRFTIDVAASAQNAKLPRFYTRETDGLSQSWRDERSWCNPPYSALRPWVEKALAEVRTNRCQKVVLLIPANRTEQSFWQDLIEPVRDRGLGVTTRFVRGRLMFGNVSRSDATPSRPRKSPGESARRSSPPFGCVLVIIEPAAPLFLVQPPKRGT
jgi:phage N-6-adenine-methyltransferase